MRITEIDNDFPSSFDELLKDHPSIAQDFLKRPCEKCTELPSFTDPKEILYVVTSDKVIVWWHKDLCQSQRKELLN